MSESQEREPLTPDERRALGEVYKLLREIAQRVRVEQAAADSQGRVVNGDDGDRADCAHLAGHPPGS